MKDRPSARLLPIPIALLVAFLSSAFAAFAIDCPSCDDLNDCTLDSCDTTTGTCRHDPVPNGTSCNDGRFCTVGDFCSGGNCLGGGPRNCSDLLSCTDDRCIETPPHCESIPNNALCPPSTACVNISCQTFGPGPSGCVGAPLTGNPCNDGNPCTGGDVCSNGTCRGTPLNCDDGNVCTADACTSTGCRHSNISCNDGNVCTTDSCDPVTGCFHQPNTGQTTCGTGACQRTVDACVGGVPQPCVPGTPTAEVCNGIDDDCDGLVDEDRVQADCTVSPSTLNLDSQGSIFSLTCKLFDVCDPGLPTPISGSTVSQVYVSRADSADSSADDVTLPEPSTLPCPDPILGSLYERGISENLGARDVSNANVTFKFNLPSDGDCSTLDGDRQDLAGRLTAIPDNTNATVCISGKTGGADFQSCVQILVRNKGLR